MLPRHLFPPSSFLTSCTVQALHVVVLTTSHHSVMPPAPGAGQKLLGAQIGMSGIATGVQTLKRLDGPRHVEPGQQPVDLHVPAPGSLQLSGRHCLEVVPRKVNCLQLSPEQHSLSVSHVDTTSLQPATQVGWATQHGARVKLEASPAGAALRGALSQRQCRASHTEFSSSSCLSVLG